MDKKFVVVGLGEMLWDHIGEEYKLGGAPANFAYHAMQLGGESHVVSAVGDDHLGKKLTADLSQTNMLLDTQVVDFPTGVVEVTLADGQPSYEIKLDAAWDNMQFTPALEELAKRTDLVCFGTLAQRNSVSRDTIQKFLDTMPDTETSLKVFDVNLRQSFYSKALIEETLSKSNVLKINNDELVMFNNYFGYEGLQLEENFERIIRDFNLKYLIVTFGEYGSYVARAGEVHFERTPKVDLVSAVGAGDSFTGSFCMAVMRGLDMSVAHKIAVDVSAYVCTQPGAMPEIPETLKARLK